MDFYGSNQLITKANFNDLSLWTWLGRACFPGLGGGGTDFSTVSTKAFNSKNYGGFFLDKNSFSPPI